MIKLLLVDDQDLIRRGLKALLMTDLELNVIGEAGNGQEALKLVAVLQPDLVLMDVRMPLIGWGCRHSHNLSDVSRDKGIDANDI